MIRVNLLGGTAEQRATIQKTKVAARRGQQIFMLVAALVIFTVAVGVDYLWTTNAHTEAKAELEYEEEEARKLEDDIKRKNELEQELKQVEERINVIKQLRAEQKGPVAMLSAINERMPGGQADFRLTGIIQKGTRLQIQGNSANQQIIADFLKQLEFSNGLFTNLMLDVKGNEVKPEEGDKKVDPDELIRVFTFTIDCDYNKPRADDGSKQEQGK